jgi:DNA-directed RNA polymerase specialized sigma24 family protein
MMSLRTSEMEELSVKYLEKATMIRTWGRMASGGLGLGYGSNVLDDGRGSPALSVEEFDRLNRAVMELPYRPRVVIINLYKLDNSIAETAIKMGDKRHNVERHQKQALTILYGIFCSRTYVDTLKNKT